MKKAFNKALASLTITAKFGGAIMLIIGILLATIAFSSITFTKAQAVSEAVFKNYGVSQGYLGEMMGSFQQQRVYLRDVMLHLSGSDLEATKLKIDAQDGNFREHLNSLREVFVDSEGIKLTQDIEASFLAFAAIRDEIMAAAQTSAQKAGELLLSDKAADAVSGTELALSTAMNYLQEHADESLAQQSLSTQANMRLLLIGGAVITIVFLSLGSFFIRSIGIPLKKLSVAADQIAAGDLSFEARADDLLEGRDETVRIRKSFLHMLEVMKRLIADIGALTDAAREGRLSVRADASAHEGVFRAMVEGVNQTLDAVIEPVNEAAAALGELSRGNLNARVEGEYEGDHAMIKNALNTTVDSLRAQIGEVGAVLQNVSEGDLTQGVRGEFAGDFDALKHSVNRIIGALNAVLRDINIAAGQVASGTKQVSDGSQAISQGATEQASSIEELTASIASIAEQTRQNALDANNAWEISAAARAGAVAGDAKMRELQKAMAEINESSASISKVIKVIDDIAFQTNILALNAAVEAARAGAQGKGFAVVAEEVRNLAAKSAQAAKETAALIEGSIHKTGVGTRMADETAEALSSIMGGMEQGAVLTEGIAAASNEQATAIAQVNRGIEQMSEVVQTNSATAQEAAAASEELSGQADLLKTMIGKFKLRSRTEQPAEKTAAPAAKAQAGVPARGKIVLNEGDFGKY